MMDLLERAMATRNEIEMLDHDYRSGKIPEEKLGGRLRLAFLKIKSEDQVYKIAMNSKRLKRLTNNLSGPIDLEKELISCPDQNGKFLSREMCLDYSGSNNGTCQSCENFGITRKMLLPEK